MKKRALMALPKLTATDEMKQIAASDLPRKEKIAYGYVQEVCEYYVYLRCITQDGILKVAFFFPEHLRIDGNSPAYEVYLDKEKRQFITYNSLNQKWCEAKLDRLDWKRRYWYTKAYWVSEEDETSIQAYDSIESSVQSHAVCPSFMSRSSGGAKTIELAWDGSQYIAELTDTNRVLSQFTFSASETGFHFSVSGNTLTITTDTAPSGNVTISATRSASRCGVLVWTDYKYGPNGGVQDN